ncbi:MAG: hypothetical protein M3R58_11325 [Pseudomonadota bacterium]|nr:hypothetical protein [Pseudomonadota bacterium]
MSIATRYQRLTLVVAASACLQVGAVTLSAVPALPAYGQTVQIQLGESEWQQYLPATRFLRSGNTIVVDYEFQRIDFGPVFPGPFMPVNVGELVPGNYTLQARLFDFDLRNHSPQIVNQTFAVMPPQAYGVYLVPQAPGAWEAANVVLRSAVYFDASTLRASVNGNVIRVDFDYDPDAPVGGALPPGYTSFASVPIDGLAPGAYRVEGFGRALPDGAPTQYFTLDFGIGPIMPVIEFYQEGLRHYFLAGGPEEVKLLDAGGQGGWKRTGHKFNAWLRQADAPANARPVCRFYAFGPNSHFFTADAFECQYLKDLEQQQRSQAAAAGARFLGWGYEGIGFWALMPQGGECEAGSDPVFRAYNNRAFQGDSNHHFTRDRHLHTEMITAWIDEGVQLCSPR